MRLRLLRPTRWTPPESIARSMTERRLERLELFQAGARFVAAQVVIGVRNVFLAIPDGLGDRGGGDFRHRYGLFGQHPEPRRAHFRQTSAHDGSLRFAIALDRLKPPF